MSLTSMSADDLEETEQFKLNWIVILNTLCSDLTCAGFLLELF